MTVFHESMLMNNAELRRAVEARQAGAASMPTPDQLFGGGCCDGGKCHATPEELEAGWREITQASSAKYHAERLTGDSLLADHGDGRLGSREFLELVEELRQLHLEKTAQYGDEADPFANVSASAKCGVEPWRRALCDLSDCVVRLQRHASGQPVDIENAALDAANWALICLLKMREANRG